MLKLIMMKGLPGSGKSTIAKAYVDSFGMVRVNKDDLRSMLHNSKYSKANEKEVLKIRDMIIRNALSNGKSVVVDDTNFAPSHEITLKEIAENHKATFEVKFIDAPLDVCIEQDLKRFNSVGEKVIRRMYNQYLRVIETPKTSEAIENNPCYIFDIDGTLAHMQGRSPYDESLVSTDTLDNEVAMINGFIAYANEGLEDLVGKRGKVFVVSGRHDSCREDTEKWLKDNNIFYDELHMRKADDDRSDTIIKSEIYEEHINGKYKVWGIFDDRNRVVDMWRNKGLKVFQVAEGDF